MAVARPKIALSNAGEAFHKSSALAGRANRPAPTVRPLATIARSIGLHQAGSA